MMRNTLLFFLMFFLSHCALVSTEVAGSQKIQIRVWGDNTPKLLTKTGELAVDIAEENVVNYNMKIIDSHIYLAYTTDKSVLTACRPNAGWDPFSVPDQFKDPITGNVPNNLVKYRIITSQNKEVTIALDDKGKEINRFEILLPRDKGVWVRLLQGTLSGSERNIKIDWKMLIAQDQTMDITDLVILPIKNQEATIVAVSNQNEIIVFNDIDQDGILNWLYTDLLGLSFSEIDQLNSWQKGDDTFLAMVADQQILITGVFIHAGWNLITSYKQTFDMEQLQVQSGYDFPYAIWVNKNTQKMTLAIYNASGNLNRWLEIDSLSAIKCPKLSIKLYRDDDGILWEDIYVGTVNIRKNFFQLFEVRNLQLNLLGPIITEWNESYTFAGNELGQVLFVRSNFDQQLIFAGLNSLRLWEQVQRNDPPTEIVHASSFLETVFINNFYSLTIFKRGNGSIYFLAGIR
ncbi:MAG: hypothetical protein ACRCWI_00330 [Brevinema sp.]